MVMSYDFLDSMAWTVAISGFLLAASSIELSNYSSQTNEKNKPLRYGFGVSIGACGVYLFISGLAISFIWPFTISGGAYNVLFGGIATLGGLVLLADAVTLFLNADLRPVSYLAAVAGLYAAVDAYAIISNSLTESPLLAALGYLSFTAPAILSIPVAHTQNKWWRLLFTIFAILFAAAWLYQAANYTIAHLQPP